VDLIGNDFKLIVRLFSFLFLLGGMPWVMGVFHSEKLGECKRYLGDFLGLREGLELGSEDDEWS
jgi:hypothetical protein